MRLLRIVFGDGHDLTESSGNDASVLLKVVETHHCVGLSAPSLTIGENGAVVAVENRLDESKGALFVDEALWGVDPKDAVERECFGGFLGVFLFEEDLVVLAIDFYHAGAPCLGQSVPLSRSLAFMGRHRTITLTASDIESPDKNINSQPSKLYLYKK